MWGDDLEKDGNGPRCEKYLNGNTKFPSIKESFPEVMSIFYGIALGAMPDDPNNPDRKHLELQLLDDKLLPLPDEKFNKGLDDFLEKTNGRYNKESLKTLRLLAHKNPDNFREKAGFHMRGCVERMFDRAIENSQNGLPTILDVVPFGGNIGELFEKYSESKNFTCPTRTALIHVPISELATRMGERNRQALASGNPENQRTGTFVFDQYTNAFGAKGESSAKLPGEELRRGDIHAAVYEFGKDEGGKKIYDMESQTEAALATIKQSKGLLEKLGFEGMQELIQVGAMLKSDIVYDHLKMPTSEIAKGIRDLL